MRSLRGRSNRIIHRLLAASCTLALVTAATQAQAQDAATDKQPSEGLAEIVVTAQKRSENVQRIPLAVTAVSGDALAAQGVVNVGELSRIDPTLQIGQASGSLTTFIRGIGNPVTTAGNEASVPVYIDDVYFVRAGFAFLDLVSIERVEVLKGPQGTLFGRNASGGVINITTRDPSTSGPSAELSAGYSSFNTIDAKLYANIPLSENLAANLSASYHNQQDGWGKNKVLVDPLDTSKGFQDGGADYWRSRSFSTRGKLLWTPTETTSVKLVGYYQDSFSTIGAYSRPYPGTIAGTPDGRYNNVPLLPGMPNPPQVLPRLGFYDVHLGEGAYDDSHGGGISLRVDQELGFADFVSITAWRKANEVYHSAGSNTPYKWISYDLTVLDKQFSQEFQLKSNSGSPINWIAGLYYLDADGGFAPTRIDGPGYSAQFINAIDIVGRQNVKSYAAFGQITVPLGEQTNVTGGLRYTIDEVRGSGTTTISFLQITGLSPLVIPNSPAGGFKRTFKKPTWKLGIDHKLSPDVMVYANYSRGFKAGTHNTLPLDAPALDPEVVDAYEIGFKSELLDRRLRINVAAFWNDISNPQVQSQRAGLVFLTNAGSARTKGVEADITGQLSDGLTLRLSGSYLDAKFREFPNAPTYVYDPASVGNLTVGTPINAKGNWMPYASKWKFGSNLNYEKEVADFGKIAVDVSANWSSKFYWEADNAIAEPSRFLVDTSVAFTPAALENVTFRLWAKNLTREKYNINFFSQAGSSAYSSAPGAPRTIGADVTLKF